MNNNIKKLTKTFIKKYKLTSIDYFDLKNVASNMGYTVIEFNSIFNEKDVETVIRNLDLNENALKSRGFTYVSAEYRLIFVNEDLNDEEKLLVLSHELGHILCEHFSTSPIIGNDVKDEHDANEFSHYLLKKSGFRKVKNAISVHRKAFVASVVILCLIIGSLTAYLIIRNRNVYEDNLYITSTGECYHKKECIFVKNKTNIKKLTKEEFDSGTYSPCDMCLPDEN